MEDAAEVMEEIVGEVVEEVSEGIACGRVSGRCTKGSPDGAPRGERDRCTYRRRPLQRCRSRPWRRYIIRSPRR